MRKTLEALQEQHQEIRFVPCELADRSSVDRAMEVIADPVDVLIHNAASISRTVVAETSDSDWDRQLEVNLSAPFRMTRALLPGMLERKKGRVLFVSSISAVVGSARQAAYHASKAGLLGLMRCLAVELSDTGVSTMALLPGSIDTRMLDGTPFPPRMTPDEVARTLIYYASEESSAHNGAVVEMFGV
jgi:NAD(P)-dependent dehydrogenase (short-subunit alcohol dehydrogenase family)